MAQQLWMLRHGEAVPHDTKPDAERELTPRGRRQADAAGAALAALGEKIAVCYTSPKVRALETAELDRKSTRLNSSHVEISYAVFCLKKKKKNTKDIMTRKAEQS